MPSETRVSIVVEPCRPARHAARWNGQAHHRATGTDSAPRTHCQPENCQAGVMETATIGADRARETKKRRRRSATRADEARAAAASASAASTPADASRCPSAPTRMRRSTVAPYPAFTTVPTRIESSTSSACGDSSTRAFSVAKLTTAVTPGSLPSFFSTRATHEAQVIPEIASSTSTAGAAESSV